MAIGWTGFISSLLVSAFVSLAAPAHAITILRDPDIENALKQLSLPLIRAAGLSQDQITLLVVRDSSLNAFVFDSAHVFIHSGLILKMKSARELQAVVAHELAHIANGHIPRRLSNLRSAGGATRIGFLMALAIGAATGNAEAAAGVAAGSASSAQRVFFGHTRAEEASADQAALRYLSQAGVDPNAMATLLQRFLGQEALSAAHQDPYVRTHPPTRERIRAVNGYVAAYGGINTAPTQANRWFARAQAKLGAFIHAPSDTLRAVAGDDNSDLAVMRRAIAYHRLPDRSKALAEVRTLAERSSDDPYIQELRGQLLLEAGETEAAVRAYARAASLKPDNALILAGHGRALLALDTRDSLAQALKLLERAYSRDGQDPRLMRDLAIAYARNGQKGMASVATAERFALVGELGSAAIHATRALELLPKGSPGWNRAQDVLSAARSAG
ncbi:MAG: M48 family metalloprotease [Rhodobacter sp.]|nr:M48 family metalloprotease [Rhodobacter sp.]